MLTFVIGMPIAWENFREAMPPASAKLPPEIDPGTYYYVVICDGRYSTTARAIVPKPASGVELDWEPSWDLGCRWNQEGHSYELEGTLQAVTDIDVIGFPEDRTVTSPHYGGKLK